MKRITARVVAVAIVVLLSSPAGDALSQGPTETLFSDTVEVELVLVDVFVTDRAGNPVLDLARKDFRLFEDGERVEIGQFSVIHGGADGDVSTISTTAAADDSVTATDAEMQAARVVVFIDDLNLGPGRRKRLFEQLQKVLEKRLRPQDEVMVVNYKGVVETLLPFTTDRQHLKETLREAGNPQSQAIAASLGDNRILQLIEQRHTQEIQGTGFSSGDPCVDLGFIARTHAEQVYGRVQHSASELSLFIKSLAGYPGRKTLLHVSDGLPLVAGLEAYSYAIELCDGTGANKGVPGAVDTQQFGSGRYTRWDPTRAWAELTQFNSTNQFTDLSADANTYQVSIYAVQALGLSGRQRGDVDRPMTSQETATQANLNAQDPLFLMADETGGQAILNTNDFEPAFAEMVEDTRQGYQLAFTPTRESDGKQHELRVEVERPGVEVRYRKSYRHKTADERLADGVLSSLFHDLEQNPLGANLEVGGREVVTRNVTDLTMRVHVPLGRLIAVPEGNLQRGQFTVFVGVKDGHGSIMPVRKKTVPFSIAPTDLEQDPGREFVYELKIPVRGKQALVSVAVRDELGGSVSYVSRTIELGDETSESG